MILIADGGSTTVEWCVLDEEKIVKRVSTTGMNAMMLGESEMAGIIGRELMPHLQGLAIDEVQYYGAGCLFDNICANVRNAIGANIPAASRITVDTDLLAAARAVCGNKPGIVCILGTGSNSCYYDGTRIADNVPSLGYILGDEGSGAVLGKMLVGDVLKRQMPTELVDKFMKQYSLTPQLILENVYRRPGANRFLASLSPFLAENIEEPSVHRLVLNAFKSFFVRNVEGYSGYKDMPVNFVGSIAESYREVIEEAAKALYITVGVIVKSPMDGLIEYHSYARRG